MFNITGATMSAEAARELLLFNFDCMPHNIIGHVIVDIECDQLQDRIHNQLETIDGMKPVILGG